MATESRFIYKQEKPNLFIGCLLLLVGFSQLLFPIRSTVKLIIASLTYLIGTLNIIEWWKQRHSETKGVLVLNEGGMEYQLEERGWKFSWKDVMEIRVPFPSTVPCIVVFCRDVFFRSLDVSSPMKLAFTMNAITNKFDFVRELRHYCKEVQGVDALEKILTDGKLVRFVGVSILYAIGLILILFFTVPFVVYFLFLRSK